ncbi:MAG TPA: L-histidine N(alpha)-methyltransferase [Terracidiphilus sp.]|nr:L-histidine N(alpha)-methyltransferase [Terracidiphilus sp.]
MTTFAFPTFAGHIAEQVADELAAREPVVAEPVSEPIVDGHVAAAVRAGLNSRPKRLPPWLFYDKAGSRLFDEITERPEYYLTRTERGILAANADAMIAQAADGARLRITELGAGSADKTRILLKAVVAHQGTVVYEPVDVSASALEAAKKRIEREIPEVLVTPRVMDYTRGSGRGLHLEPTPAGERRLVLYIGSSIGNFEPREAMRLLQRVRAGLNPGDGLLLGVDLVKDEATLLAAYDDAAGVTADFNLNLLARLNRELGAEFPLDSFEHHAVWNQVESRIEMHLESRVAQKISLSALDLEVEFAQGETIHTENSYKYRPGQAEVTLAAARFVPAGSWTDERGWFGVCVGRAE